MSRFVRVKSGFVNPRLLMYQLCTLFAAVRPPDAVDVDTEAVSEATEMTELTEATEALETTEPEPSADTMPP